VGIYELARPYEGEVLNVARVSSTGLCAYCAEGVYFGASLSILINAYPFSMVSA